MKISSKTESSVYFDLMLTLLALAFVGFFYYGIRTALICLIAAVSSLVADFICIKIRGKHFLKEDFGNSLVTGMIIALMMPSSIPYNILIITCFFAIIIGKQVFGGRENMLFSPAAVGYIFAVVSWKDEVLQYPKPYAELSLQSNVSNTLFSSLSSTVNTTGTTNVTDTDLMLGIFTGPFGTCSVVVLTACFLVLIFRNSISKLTAVGVLASCAVIFFFFGNSVNASKSLVYGMICNMVVFGAIFISADINMTPQLAFPRLIYGLFIGVITCFLTFEFKLENAIVFASVIASPIALALDDYTNRVKIKIYKLKDKYIEPFVLSMKKKVNQIIKHDEKLSKEE